MVRDKGRPESQENEMKSADAGRERGYDILQSGRTSSEVFSTPRKPKTFPPKICSAASKAGTKLKQRLREWPNYTLPNW